ncbi:zinc-dependent alcohol dehydrogenase [Lentzea flaviverrucosa]|uniref:2-desacetyl-2-hydroxyethyl bacteriochlorophyllide A dehydrogenase n=1 Tax=Lentzea flaviverrucosa TaxID=200379 RepID=A0A1H9BGU6_9PSEU|nr:alcohol dehydrogenase catalytic domain-containing protein [Lentzea flaviverrucosa]RDI31781.1 2-desacetyl-2-hydroxyethyl bacteriochlorophyllide A dehydrogenase [Lentzea flaviverrucosa]SEP87951.1 2-desacetyl-2-hydroxyethyl bacteriochlorophyllide A dehydrogenase [Lentzea flaviverrucosa]
MRALVITEERGLRLAEVQECEPAPGWVRVDVAFCAICGSDLHLRAMPHLVPAGAVLGHEISGHVAAPGGERLSAGQAVVVWPKAGCGDCDDCRAGDNHLCAVQPWWLSSLGLGTRPGGYADSVVVPEHTVYAVPAGVPLEHAALTEPLSCAVHAADRSGVSAADTVTILGGGTIGFLLAHVLRLRGVEDVRVVEPNAVRRARLSSTGITAVDVDERITDADVVFECVGSVTALTESARRLRARGTIVALGVNERPAELDSVALITKEIRIVGSFAQNRGAFEAALDLLGGGEVPLERIITHVVPLDGGPVAAMMDVLSGQPEDHQVVMIAPGG